MVNISTTEGYKFDLISIIPNTADLALMIEVIESVPSIYATPFSSYANIEVSFLAPKTDIDIQVTSVPDFSKGTSYLRCEPTGIQFEESPVSFIMQTPLTGQLFELLQFQTSAISLGEYFGKFIKPINKEYFLTVNATLPVESQIPIKYERRYSGFLEQNPLAAPLISQIDSIFNNFPAN